MTEHNWVDDAPVIYPTVGYRYRTCDRCGVVQVHRVLNEFDELDRSDGIWGYRTIGIDHAPADDCDVEIIITVLND